MQSPLRVALKHFAFAKIRFDATADPCAKVALMLLPLATLLAYLVADERLKKVDRDKAAATLRLMTTEFCYSIGIFEDWGLVCQAFL